MFEPFEYLAKININIDAIKISYGCVYKRNGTPAMKFCKVETIEKALEEYKKLLDEDWEKTSLFKTYSYLLKVLAQQIHPNICNPSNFPFVEVFKNIIKKKSIGIYLYK